MDLISILRMLLRRWPAVLVGLALTAATANWAGGQVSSSWTARGSAIVLAPADPSGEAGYATNPYAFTGSAQVVTSTLYGILQSPQFYDAVRKRGVSGTFSSAIQPSGVVYEFTATDSTPSGALKTLRATVEQTSLQLAEMQKASGAPEGSWMRLQVLLEDEKATEERGRGQRAQIILGGLGLLLTLASVVVWESIAQRKPRGPVQPRTPRLRRAARRGGPSAAVLTSADPAAAPMSSARPAGTQKAEVLAQQPSTDQQAAPEPTVLEPTLLEPTLFEPTALEPTVPNGRSTGRHGRRGRAGTAEAAPRPDGYALSTDELLDTIHPEQERAAPERTGRRRASAGNGRVEARFRRRRP